MIDPKYLNVLKKIHARLENTQIDWVITGSFGFALQGVDVEVHDIDIQTGKKGAYEIERLLREYVVTPVRYAISERIRSHLGALEIDGIKVEIIGEMQKLLDDQTWEDPIELERFRHWVEIDGMRIPVLSLEYEVQAYLKLGRTKKAEMLRKWLHQTQADRTAM